MIFTKHEMKTIKITKTNFNVPIIVVFKLLFTVYFLTTCRHLICTYQNDIVGQRFFRYWYDQVINGLANVVNAFNQQQQQFCQDAGPLHFIHFIFPERRKWYVFKNYSIIYKSYRGILALKVFTIL